MRGVYKAAVESGLFKTDFYDEGKNKDHFVNLCHEIIGQQLSVKAARAILGRFRQLFPKGKVEPKVLLKLEDQVIRDVGLSWAKVKYVKDLAERVVRNEIEIENLEKLSDEEVMEELIKVKGIGPWTVEMYLMFTLGRPDVFSVGDLGLRRAMKKLYGLEKPNNDELVAMAAKWSPYRTYACRVLWKSLDNED